MISIQRKQYTGMEESNTHRRESGTGREGKEREGKGRETQQLQGTGCSMWLVMASGAREK